jgi:precorrin-2 dehydrogenase/sirohydrochlorin ferrochelatase
VIGGGPVAEQKVRSLLEAGAHVTVVSPDLTPTLVRLAGARRIVHHARPYQHGDLTGMFIAVAATDDAALHGRIAADARAAGALLNVVDQPALCDFIAPAVMRRGDLLVAASTGGASPALAGRVRRELEGLFGPEYALAADLLRRLRERVARRGLPAAERRRIFASLVDSPLLDHLRRGEGRHIDALLAATVGGGVSLASLGIDLAETR